MSSPYLMSGIFFFVLLQLLSLGFSMASDVCSATENPCLSAMEASNDLDFLYGLNKDQLSRACDIYVKSMHCLDYSLATCAAQEREEAKNHVRFLRISMDRICNDNPTRTSYLVYSGCLKKAYPKTELCRNRFTEILQNSSQMMIAQQREALMDSETGQVAVRVANPKLFPYICNGLRHLITCIHHAVPCAEKSHRGIKEILTLMIRGGVPSQLYQHCFPIDSGAGGAKIQSSSAAGSVNQFTYSLRITIVCTAFFFGVLPN